MRAVADSNVIAYYLLGTEPFRAECSEFWAEVGEVMAPASWEAEIANVLWMAVRSRVIELPDALHRLELVSSLGIRSEPVAGLWNGALTRGCASGIAVYDTLFVELAERESLPLATFDKAVLKAFPRIARRPRAVVRSR